MCQSLHCKYIQVSAALNHRVDDLLAGLVPQIRLNPDRRDLLTGTGTLVSQSTKYPDPRAGCLTGAKQFLVDLLAKKRHSTSNCDNLWIL
jgi:hypothetical protein